MTVGQVPGRRPLAPRSHSQAATLSEDGRAQAGVQVRPGGPSDGRRIRPMVDDATGDRTLAEDDPLLRGRLRAIQRPYAASLPGVSSRECPRGAYQR
jgi:hypothetical protein